MHREITVQCTQQLSARERRQGQREIRARLQWQYSQDYRTYEEPGKLIGEVVFRPLSPASPPETVGTYSPRYDLYTDALIADGRWRDTFIRAVGSSAARTFCLLAVELNGDHKDEDQVGACAAGVQKLVRDWAHPALWLVHSNVLGEGLSPATLGFHPVLEGVSVRASSVETPHWYPKHYRRGIPQEPATLSREELDQLIARFNALAGRNEGWRWVTAKKQHQDSFGRPIFPEEDYLRLKLSFTGDEDCLLSMRSAEDFFYTVFAAAPVLEEVGEDLRAKQQAAMYAQFREAQQRASATPEMQQLRKHFGLPDEPKQ